MESLTEEHFGEKHYEIFHAQISEGDPHYEAVLGTRGEGFTLRSTSYDAQGNTLPLHRRLLYRRLQRLQKMVDAYESKKDSQVVMELNRAANSLGLTKQAKERAINIYLKASHKLAKSSRREHLIIAAASILIAVRELGHTAPITLQEIAEVFSRKGLRIRPMRIVRHAKLIEKLIGSKTPLRNVRDYIIRVIDQVISDSEVQQKLKKRAINQVEYRQTLLLVTARLLSTVEKEFGGRRPLTVATTAVYAADRALSLMNNSKPLLTQRLLARITGVSECTIREHYNTLFRIHVLRYALSRSSNIYSH